MAQHPKLQFHPRFYQRPSLDTFKLVILNTKWSKISLLCQTLLLTQELNTKQGTLINLTRNLTTDIYAVSIH